jgi:hypothetical protein
MTELLGPHDIDAAPLLVESGPTSTSASVEVVVAAATGPFASCDVWFNLPAAWIGQAVILRLYARLGAARVLVRQVSLGNVPSTVGTDGSASALAIAARGRPCTSFELSVEAATALTGGLFYLQLWGDKGSPHLSGGGTRPEAPTAMPIVAAALLGRDAASGNYVPVATDASGHILIVIQPT